MVPQAQPTTNTLTQAFERGCTDAFSFRLRYVGKMLKLLVQHDNGGANAAWHLRKVVVTCSRDNRVRG